MTSGYPLVPLGEITENLDAKRRPVISCRCSAVLSGADFCFGRSRRSRLHRCSSATAPQSSARLPLALLLRKIAGRLSDPLLWAMAAFSA
jgi:hypothetical protein